MTEPNTSFVLVPSERLQHLHDEACRLSSGLAFDLRKEIEFGPDYNQAIKDSLRRLDACCDTLADILLAARPSPTVDAGEVEATTRAYMKSKYGAHSEWNTLTEDEAPHMRIALQALDAYRSTTPPSPTASEDELAYAQRLATVAAQKCDCVPDWRPLNDMMGVLSQIDNALTGLVLCRDAPRDLTTEADRWIESAYRKPDDPDEDDAFRFTRYNMQVAYRAGYEACPTPVQGDPTVSRKDLAEMIDKVFPALPEYLPSLRQAAIEAIADKLISSGVVRGQDWRPIETAPKEPYTKVLGWCLVPVGDEVRLIQRNHAGTWTAYGATQRPTHWQPLPAQPDGGGR